MRRISLDDILVRRAGRTQGVDLHEGAVANDLLQDNGKFQGVRWKKSGQQFEAQARVVVGADGVRSFLARQVQPVVEHEQPAQRAIYFAYFHGIKPMEGPASEFLFQWNSLVYCFSTDNQ